MNRSAAAAVDLGTNTALLLVARPAAGRGLEVVLDRSVTARLGEGLATRGRLDDGAIERTLGALAEYAGLLDSLGVPRARRRFVATAVLRRATDAERFLAMVRERLGVEIVVLSEEEEARLGYEAVVADGAGSGAIVIDVGGGSTEMVAEGGRLRRSTPIGAVVLTERFLGLGDRPASEPGGFEALLAEARAGAAVFPAGAAAQADEVVLIGGSAVNLAALVRGARRFDPALAEGERVPGEAVLRWALRLADTPLARRFALPIERDRAEILPAGIACLGAVLERLGAREARISGRGLRYGVVREILGA